MSPAVLDATIALSMVFLAASTTFLVAALLGVIWKGRDTLGAIERLAITIDQEVGPTAVQVREVLDGVNQLKGVTTQRITAVTHKVEEVTGTVGTAVDQAHKQTSVLKSGLLAGITAYFSPKAPQDTDKQIRMDRGDRHELKQ